jgi:hypothetical protein
MPVPFCVPSRPNEVTLSKLATQRDQVAPVQGPSVASQPSVEETDPQCLR